jgi:hypothetical protein
MWEKIEWFGDIAKRSIETPPEPPRDRPYTSESIKGSSEFLAVSLVLPHIVSDYSTTHPEEDVISFISYVSVKSDVTKQWVPFGLHTSYVSHCTNSGNRDPS